MVNPEIIGGKSPQKRFWYVLYLVILISAIEGFSQYNIKKGNGDHNYTHLVYGIIGYSVICFLLWKSYNFEAMGHVNLLWSCVSIIIAYMIGIKFFKETHNKYTCYAILFALAAIYMSYLSDKEGFSHFKIPSIK